MHYSVNCGDHAYRLVLKADARGAERVVEFAARGPEAAMLLAQRQFAGREVEVFQDGRSLGRLRNQPDGGFWTIIPAAPRVAAAAGWPAPKRSALETQSLPLT